ncbi:MAG: carbohydrate ABC transporter permease [Kiritimatiellaeota bacterium]|nr:carbohydrate ABC transporter permease [Kiritimatiellota bacterium]
MAARTKKTHDFAKHSLIWFVLFFAFFPLYIMFEISLKDNAQFVRNPWFPFPPYHWENWRFGWQLVNSYIANSILVSTVAVAATLVTALLSAFVFARYDFPGKTALWYLLLGLLFMPGIMNLVPLFILMKDLNLLNSLVGLTILYTVGGQVFCVFVLRNFIEDIPSELFEAAQVDGAGPIQQVFRIVVPMSGSILATLAILRFLGSWNNFIQPLVFISDDFKQLIPVGLMRLDGEYVKQWGQMMAGFTIAAIPLVLIFLFTMRLFVRGLTAGAVKG